MKEFVFINNFENKLDDFKKFIGNPKDAKFVNVVCTIGNSVTLSQISNIAKIISDNIAKDAEVEFKTIVDERSNPDDIIVKIKIKED